MIKQVYIAINPSGQKLDEFPDVLDAIVYANENPSTSLIFQTSMLAFVDGRFTPEFIEKSQEPTF